MCYVGVKQLWMWGKSTSHTGSDSSESGRQRVPDKANSWEGGDGLSSSQQTPGRVLTLMLELS